MKKFVVEFDCQDGLILLDSSKVRSISEEILNSLNIMLDRDGKTELIYDFPSESWQVVWERESTIFQQFCNAGNAVLFLLPGGDRRYKEIGLKIWYTNGRYNAQTAVSRLWSAIAGFKLGYHDGGRRELAMAVSLLFSDKFDFDRFDRYMTKAVKIYEEYESEK